MRKGFTIVELLMVIGIILVLAGIVTTAGTGALKGARADRAKALFHLVQGGISAYYAQYDEWPKFNPSGRTGNHYDSSLGRVDENVYDLSATEVRESIKEVIRTVKSKNPLIDVSGLWVSRSDGDDDNGRGVGMDFLTAIRGSRNNQTKMKLSDMYFGYQNASNGRFVRFGIGYNISLDQMTVGERKDHKGNERDRR